MCEIAKNQLNEYLTGISNSLGSDILNIVHDDNYITGVDIEMKQNLYGHHFGLSKKFLKITLACPGLVNKVKKAFGSEGDSQPSEGSALINLPFCDNWIYETFESYINHELRFMVDLDITGCNWLEIPSGKFLFREKETEKETFCQIEIDV
ncbi:MAG: DNA polymerase delta catalytic subunit, partial [Paramarteilia canceri]